MILAALKVLKLIPEEISKAQLQAIIRRRMFNFLLEESFRKHAR